MELSNPIDMEALSALLNNTAADSRYGDSAPGTKTSLPTVNTKTHMSTLRNSIHSPPKGFLPFLPPPLNLPVRVASNIEALAQLDAIYQHKLDNGHEPVEFGGQTSGRGGPPEEIRTKNAIKALERHIQHRLPYVQLASRRLQAVTGERNELPFDLPDFGLNSPWSPMSAGYRVNGPHLDAGGLAARAVARGGIGSGGGKKDCRIGMVPSPRSPKGMFHSVEKETGRGLREFLLLKGKEYGMRKRECRSISFHDLTPHEPNQTFSNVLLGHYSVKRSERVDVYEINL